MDRKRTNAVRKQAASKQNTSRRPAAQQRRSGKPVRRKGLLYQVRDFFVRAVTAVLLKFDGSGNGQRRRKKGARSRLPIFYITAGIAVVIFLFVMIHMLTVKNGYEVAIGDKKLGVVAIRKEITGEVLFDTAVKKLESDLGSRIETEQSVMITPVHAKKKEMVMPDYIISEIYNNLVYKVQAISIMVNGTEFGIVKDQATAEALFADIASPYTEEGEIVESETGFVESVELKEVFVEKEDIISVETIKQALTATTEVYDSYTVVSGDVMGGIAAKVGMTLDELYGKNPQYMENTILKIGDELTIVTKKPVLSVITVEEITYTEPAPMPVEKRENPNEYKTYSRVVQQGKDGVREVTAHITKVNGKESKREPVRTAEVTPPVAEIVEVGTSQTVPRR